MPNGLRVMQTSRKMRVKAASRMVSAISLGVFWRCAPSTSAIMRSRKPPPFSIVTRMTMRSLKTRVPPVTALRSPPLSRMTGADSPVMAASSTLAMPSTTSPSAGITSPASHTTKSPFCNSGAGTFSSRPWRRRRAIVSLRALRRVAACALPRPSATASAKLANKTVNQSQRASCAMKPRSVAEVKMPAVVNAAPTIVTNMTGFRIISRGSSFLNESAMAGPTMSQSNREGGVCVINLDFRLKQFSLAGEEVFDNRTKRQCRQKIQRADQQDRAQEQHDEGAARDRECSRTRWGDFLLHERASQGHDRHDHEKATDEHGQAQGRVIPGGIARQTGEGAAVVARGGTVGVDHFTEAVRAGVVQPGQSPGADGGPGGKAQDADRQDQQGQHGHLDVVGLDFLAEILGGASDHQPRDEHRQHYEDQHAVKPRPDASENDFPELNVEQRNEAAEGCERVVHGIDRAARGVRRDRREQRGIEDAKSDFPRSRTTNTTTPPPGTGSSSSPRPPSRASDSSPSGPGNRSIRCRWKKWKASE